MKRLNVVEGIESFHLGDSGGRKDGAFNNLLDDLED
jgi:hypothetical protein